MSKVVDLEGKRFSRILVLKRHSFPQDNRKTKLAHWVCVCDCGTFLTIRGSSLTTGNTESCGCYRTELLAVLKTKHGKRHTSEFGIWCNIRRRCYSPNVESYKYYGARGIIVCERWRKSFSDFYADMGPKPSPKHSIDRIDVNGNYEPSNCRWATSSEQALNKRRAPLRVFGVYYIAESKTWSATVGRKKYRRFKTKEEADKAHMAWREEVAKQR